MPYALWIIQTLLGLLFIFSGGMKFVMSVAEMTKDMPSMPGWFLHFIGVMEILGGLDAEVCDALVVRDNDLQAPEQRRCSVVAVAFEGEKTLTGEPALGELLEWITGTFEFVGGEVADRPEIDMSTQQLLMTVAKRVDEARRVASLAPPRPPSSELPAVNLDASDSIRPNRR